MLDLHPLGEVFRQIDKDPEARVVILSAAGKMFTSGIDLSDLTQLAGVVFGEQDIARKSLALHSKVRSSFLNQRKTEKKWLHTLLLYAIFR